MNGVTYLSFWGSFLTQGVHKACASHLRVPAMPWGVYIYICTGQTDRTAGDETNVTDLTLGLKSITKRTM